MFTTTKRYFPRASICLSLKRNASAFIFRIFCVKHWILFQSGMQAGNPRHAFQF